MTSVVPQMSIYCPRLALHEGLLPHWRNLLFSDPSLRCIMLLKANRHLQFYHWMDSYSENAMQEAAKYKLLCLQKLRRDIQEEVATLTFSNATIALAFVIALDEVSTVFPYCISFTRNAT